MVNGRFGIKSRTIVSIVAEKLGQLFYTGSRTVGTTVLHWFVNSWDNCSTLGSGESAGFMVKVGFHESILQLLQKVGSSQRSWSDSD